MSFELRDHTADVAVQATADTLDGVFAAVADGLAAAMCTDVPADGDRFSLSVAAESCEALLFDYLDELIYKRDVRSVLPVDNETTIRETTSGWELDATARGVPLTSITAREVKAVTYSDMELETQEDAWTAYVVFDV